MPKERVSRAPSTSHASRASDKNFLKIHRFLGLSLGGSKSDHTALVVLDYYPVQKKLFLTQVYEKIRQHEEVTSEEVLLEIIKQHKESLQSLTVDVPLELPICLNCTCKAPSLEKCREKEVKWMWKVFRKAKRKKPRLKIFTPFTTRACEMFVAMEIDGDFHGLEALGANTAPLTARMSFLKKRLKSTPLLETYPRLSVLKMGQGLKVPQSHLKHYKHAVGGDESRMAFLQSMIRQDWVFIYQADLHKLVDDVYAFDAFICAFTGFLKAQGKTEKPPKDFPNQTGWIEIPL